MFSHLECLGIVSAALLLAVSVFYIGNAFAQMSMNDSSDSMSMNGSSVVNATISPAVYSLPNSNMEIRMAWEPETINTNDTTVFTFEFLDMTTQQRIEDVSFSVHMTLDGKSMGHAHSAAAPQGIGTVEQKFDTMGNLGIIVESIRVGDSPVTEFVQFNLNVIPEFPSILLLVTSIVSVGAVAASKYMRITQ